MKGESIIIITGLILIIIGIISFYSIQSNPDLDQSLRQIKHGGTFVGLVGIGVMMAGILLRLMDREEVPIQGNFEA